MEEIEKDMKITKTVIRVSQNENSSSKKRLEKIED